MTMGSCMTNLDPSPCPNLLHAINLLYIQSLLRSFSPLASFERVSKLMELKVKKIEDRGIFSLFVFIFRFHCRHCRHVTVTNGQRSVRWAESLKCRQDRVSCRQMARLNCGDHENDQNVSPCRRKDGGGDIQMRIVSYLPHSFCHPPSLFMSHCVHVQPTPSDRYSYTCIVQSVICTDTRVLQVLQTFFFQFQISDYAPIIPQDFPHFPFPAWDFWRSAWGGPRAMCSSSSGLIFVVSAYRLHTLRHEKAIYDSDSDRNSNTRYHTLYSVSYLLCTYISITIRTVK